MEELENLHFPILEGDLIACNRACQLEDESTVEGAYACRDSFVTIFSKREGFKPDLEYGGMGA